MTRTMACTSTRPHSLCRTVAKFLRRGIEAAQPALVIATPVHRERIASHLNDGGIPVNRFAETGELLLVDAQTALDAFMITGEPDRKRFTTIVGELVDHLTALRDTAVCGYGEMVDLLAG
jgi:hypothetical protein